MDLRAKEIDKLLIIYSSTDLGQVFQIALAQMCHGRNGNTPNNRMLRICRTENSDTWKAFSKGRKQKRISYMIIKFTEGTEKEDSARLRKAEQTSKRKANRYSK